MPEGGGYSEEVILNYLVAKFHVDPQSVQQAMQDMKALFSGQREAAKAESDLAALDYNASLELQAEKQKQYFDGIEAGIRKHWDERLKVVKDNAEKEREIHQKLNEDLGMLQKAREDASTKEEKHSDDIHKKHEERSYNLLKLGKEQENMLTSLGISRVQLANFMSKAEGFSPGVAVSMYAGYEYAQFAEGRRDRLASMALARGGGMEGEFGSEIAGYLTEIPKTTGFKKEQVAQTMAALLPMAPGGATSGEGFAELTRNTMLLGASSGVAPTDVAKLMTQYRMLDQIPVSELTDKFNGVINASKMADVSTQTFVGWLTTAAEQGKAYNVSVDDSKNMLMMFSRELKEGILTVQQLSAVQKAVSNAPEGFRALMGQQAMQKGGELARYLESIGATESAAAMAAAVETIGQERIIGPDGTIRTPEAGSRDAQVAERRKREMEIILRDWIVQNARETGTGAAGYVAMMEKFAVPAGLGGGTGASLQTQLGMLGMTPGKPTPEQQAELKTAEERMGQQIQDQREHVHWIRKATEGLSLLFDSSHQVASLFYRMTGQEEKAKAVEEAYKERTAEYAETGGLFYGGGATRRSGEMAEAMRKQKLNPYMTDFVPGNLILNVNNNTGMNSLDFKLRNKNVSVPTELGKVK